MSPGPAADVAWRAVSQNSSSFGITTVDDINPALP